MKKLQPPAVIKAGRRRVLFRSDLAENEATP
jgi:hypothetical protein